MVQREQVRFAKDQGKSDLRAYLRPYPELILEHTRIRAPATRIHRVGTFAQETRSYIIFQEASGLMARFTPYGDSPSLRIARVSPIYTMWTLQGKFSSHGSSNDSIIALYRSASTITLGG
jgi:hypothetical protein